MKIIDAIKGLEKKEMTKKQFIACAIGCIVLGTIVANLITLGIKAVLP